MMRKKTSTEEYLTIADRHIEAAEKRIREQKRRLFDMAGRGEDVSQKVQFLGLLNQALRSMRFYRDGMAQSRAEMATLDAGDGRAAGDEAEQRRGG